MKQEKINKKIKGLAGIIFDKSITTHTTKIKEIREQLKESYQTFQVNYYQSLTDIKEQNDFIKYLEGRAK